MKQLRSFFVACALYAPLIAQLNVPGTPLGSQDLQSCAINQ